VPAYGWPDEARGKEAGLSGDIEAIRRVIEAFEKSDWTEIDVRAGSIRVHLSVESRGITAASVSTGNEPAPSPPPSTTAETASPEPTITAPADAYLVRSPSPGIFWRSPQPGAPPFADIGQHVGPDATMCIVEVMKLMNHVKAAVRGTVVAVLGRDGTQVDKDEPLFAVARDDGAG
jgi:acetyl-CoA carboxylase biotin carboxyl carrier protein